MNTEQVINSLNQYKGSFVTLGQLKEWISSADYSGLYAVMTRLEQIGLLQPVGSVRDNNGMVPPLRLKYRILRPQKDDSAALDEIRQLSPALNISGYLKKLKLYRKHRELLLPLNDYLKRCQGELAWPMARNERAFAVWHNEKQLDSALCRSMLRFNGWEARLNTYPTPEPFFDYLMGGQIQTLLILENKDTWYTLRRLFLQHPEKRRLFGAHLDGVVLGEGRKATRPHALEEYAALLPGVPSQFLYFGDLDYAGIDIFLSVAEQNPALDVSLFLPAYRAMLRRGRTTGYGFVHTDQTKPVRMADFLDLFAAEEAEEIVKLCAAGHYLPQEILTCPFLEQQLGQGEDGDV